jgi:hypothetical protein
MRSLTRTSAKSLSPIPSPPPAPPFAMSTSGRPKGYQHATGGSLAYVRGSSKYVQDIQPDDTCWCVANIGWITGHSHVVYGPLPLATTSVIDEGVARRAGGVALEVGRAVRPATAHGPSRDACWRPSDATQCRTVGEVRPVQPTDSKGCGAPRPASAPRAPADARAVIRSGGATRIRTG